MKKTIQMFNRDIPLTKSGNPNMRYLSTKERKIYKEYLELKQRDTTEKEPVTIIEYTL